MSKYIDKYKQMNTQAKSAIWFVFCSILQKGIAFITVPIFTRLLTTEQYGTYSLYLSWFQILTIITSLYLYNGVFNNGMTKFDFDRDTFTSAMQGITVSITIVLFVVFLFTKKAWCYFMGLSFVSIVLMFIEMLVTPAMSFWLGRQRFEYRYKKLVIVTILKSIMNPILGLIAVFMFIDRATARIASVVVVEVLFCGTIMIYQFYKGKVFFHKEYWKYAICLAIPLLPHYLSGMVLNQGDKVMIEKILDKTNVAIYSVAYNIGMLVQIFTMSLSNAFTPWAYQKIKNKEYKNIGNTVNGLLIVVAIITLCLMLCGPELVLIFGSEEYKSARGVIPPVAASVFFMFLYNILALPQFYFEKTYFMLCASILAAILNIVLNYIFIPHFGIVSAGYTTLICYMAYSFGHSVVSNRILKCNSIKENIFDMRSIYFISICIVCLGIGCSFIFDYIILRYSILFFAFLIIMVEKKKITQLVVSLKK